MSVFGASKVKVYGSRSAALPCLVGIFRRRRGFLEARFSVEFFLLIPRFPRAMQPIRRNRLRESKPLPDDLRFHSAFEQIGRSRMMNEQMQVSSMYVVTG